MQVEAQAPSAKNARAFKVTRIPVDTSEPHVQKILEVHYPGALICLLKPRLSKRKPRFVTGHLTIPKSVVDQDPVLQKALISNDGVEINPLPLPKLYLRPLQAHKSRSCEDLAAKIQHLEQINQKLLTDLETIQQKQEAEIIMLRCDFEESQTQLREMINQLGNHVLQLGAHVNPAAKEIKLFSPPRKRHPRSSPPHKRWCYHEFFDVMTWLIAFGFVYFFFELFLTIGGSLPVGLMKCKKKGQYDGRVKNFLSPGRDGRGTSKNGRGGTGDMKNYRDGAGG